jgi:hypothetical protein
MTFFTLFIVIKVTQKQVRQRLTLSRFMVTFYNLTFYFND